MLSTSGYNIRVNKNKKNTKGVSSFIRDHIQDTGHNAFIDNSCIINDIGNELDLLVHENLLILRDRTMINQQNSLIPISFYNQYRFRILVFP